MYEPNLITDQESAVKEPPKNAEQSDEPKEQDKNLKEEEVADLPHELTAYGLPVEQDCPNIVKDRRKLEEGRRWKVPGVSCSFQQTLPVPKRPNFFLGVTLFTIRADVTT